MAVERAKHRAQPKRKPQITKHRTTVSIIGAGRLGTALARALSDCGYRIEAVVARGLRRARRAAELVNSHPRALVSTQLGQLPASRLLLITTPDDVIADAAAQLAATVHEPQHGRTALHASGALSSEVLSALRETGFAVGSIHPLISVSDPVQGAASLRAAFYGIEGDPAAVRVAQEIVRDLGAQSFSVNTADKALYHAAAVMAAGHLVALFDIAAEMLERCGLTETRARSVLLPLVRSTVENLSARPPARALTGTFARADLATMRRHLAALRSQADTEALAAYMLLGQRSLRLAEQNGADETTVKEMRRVLKSNQER